MRVKVVQNESSTNMHKMGRTVSWFHYQHFKLDLRMKKVIFLRV